MRGCVIYGCSLTRNPVDGCAGFRRIVRAHVHSGKMQQERGNSQSSRIPAPPEQYLGQLDSLLIRGTPTYQDSTLLTTAPPARARWLMVIFIIRKFRFHAVRWFRCDRPQFRGVPPRSSRF